MQIKLRFSYSGTLFAKLICWRDWSDYSHVDFMLPDGRLLGAKGDGVKIRTAGNVVRYLELVVDVTPEQHKKIMDFALSQLGKPYDKAGILGFVFNRDWQDDSAWFCYELVAASFNHAGVKLLRWDKLHRISSELILSPLLKDIK